MNGEMQRHYFPLSLSQQNILNLEKSLPGTSVNNISTTVRITGHVDFLLLQESIHRVLENDTSMCTRLTRADEEYLQYHVPYIREDFPVFDFSNTSREGIENWEIAETALGKYGIAARRAMVAAGLENPELDLIF